MFCAVPPLKQGNQAQRIQLPYRISDIFDNLLLASGSGEEFSLL